MKAFVQAVKVGREVKYRAMRLDVHSDTVVQSLAYDDDDHTVTFDTFHEANRLVTMFVEGPGEDVVKARWCNRLSEGCGWDELEVKYTGSVDPDRERWGGE